MSDVFYLRPIDPPIALADVQIMAQHAGGCFNLHRVDWRQSFLADDGARMLCWYRAPDAESARLALRQLGSDMNAVWAGEAFGDGSPIPETSKARVVAEIVVGEPLARDEPARRIPALREQGIEPIGGFLSARGTLLVLLFAAADVRAVERALAAIGLPPQSAWGCTPVTPKVTR